MGASNAAAVYATWGHLEDRPFRVLVYMALVSMDAHNPPTYWGGRDALATALGRQIPDAPEPDDHADQAERVRIERRRAFQSVQSAVGELVKAGAIERVRMGRVGRTTEYALKVQGRPQPTPEGRPQPLQREGLTPSPRSTEEYRNTREEEQHSQHHLYWADAAPRAH